MRKVFIYSFLLLISFTSFAQQENTADNIIPIPVSVVKNAGSFTLKNNAVIGVPGTDKEVWKVAQFLSSALNTPTGYNTTINSSAPSADIKFVLVNDTALGKEGYKLNVTSSNVTISANQTAGLFYGVQTLLQLFPKEIESKTAVSNVAWTAPAVDIMDKPRFGWRGLMLDVSRHFFTKEQVKHYIDDMVRYKFNMLHMHLTDDEGWRIEIKSLPNLTKKGAYRPSRVGYFGTFDAPAPDAPLDYGGYYTQDDIKELVQYAKDRFVDILPEIDVPGHSLAAVVSYPELSCTPGVDKYHVRSGEEIMDWSHGHPPIALVDNTLCPANEKVYDFMDKVVTEVAQLFPFEYIHLGGDECPKNFWEKSDAVKALMKREGLKNMDQVQSYFEKRVEKIVESKGKKFMGWDEILQGGLAPNAAVMSWRGMQGGIEAAKMGHEVVMSPTTYAYIDYMQGDPALEPHVYATLRLKKAYEFEPVPDGVDPKYIKGGQANLWTEQVYNMRHAEYMTYPRALAIAESVWSPKEKKNWNNFADRVQNQFARLDEAEIKYSPAVYDPIINVSKAGNGNIKIAMSTEINGLDIYYTFDNSFPDRFYPKYTEPITPPRDAVMMRVITYKGNEPVGRLISVSIDDLKKRAGNRGE